MTAEYVYCLRMLSGHFCLSSPSQVDVDIITAKNVDRAVIQLERKIKRNEEQRLRHPDEPEL